MMVCYDSVVFIMNRPLLLASRDHESTAEYTLDHMTRCH